MSTSYRRPWVRAAVVPADSRSRSSQERSPAGEPGANPDGALNPQNFDLYALAHVVGETNRPHRPALTSVT